MSSLDGDEWLIVSCLGHFTLERTPVPIKQDAEWAPELVWMFWTREKSLVPNGIRTPGRPARSLVAIPIMLLWLLRQIACISKLKGDEIREYLLPFVVECLHTGETQITIQSVKYRYHV